MATNVWNGGLNPEIWSNAADWSLGVPQSGDDVSILVGGSVLLDFHTPSSTVKSVTIANGSSLNIKDPGTTLSVTGDFTDNGGFSIDSQAFDPGGSTLGISGVLTVTNSGAGFAIGNYLQGALVGGGGSPTVTTVTANAVANTGSIVIQGDGAPDVDSKAILNVASVAGFGAQVGVLTGAVDIGGDGLHAGSQGLLEFSSGQITTIDTTGTLFEYGTKSFIADAGSLSSNSALTGLATVSGTLHLQAGASITTTGDFHITSLGSANGSVDIDTDFLGSAGSSLTVNGALMVDGNLNIGRDAIFSETSDPLVTTSAITGTGSINLNGDTTPGRNFKGTLVVHSAAGFGPTGTITGNITVQNDSLLQFDSGQINTIAHPADVKIIGTSAFIADAGSITSNSALVGLTNVKGDLELSNGASLTTSGSVTIGDVNVTNSGLIWVDQGGSGGSTLTIGGAGALNLNAGATMTIGNNGITAATNLTVSTLNAAAGGGQTLSILGNTATSNPAQTKLTVNSAASFGTAGVFTGLTVSMSGNAVLQFASGQFNTIAFGAALILNSGNSFVADAGNTSSNTALSALDTVAGVLALHNGASLSLNHGITIGNGTNGAHIIVDSGSSLNLTGAIDIQIQQDVLSVGAGLVTASALNFVGQSNSGIDVGDGSSLATLSLASAAGFGATGVLANASVNLHNKALLEFGNGQITTTLIGSSLVIDGPDAFFADSGSTTSNSALHDLALVGGSFDLLDGATLTTSGALTFGNGTNGTGSLVNNGSSLTVNGLLTIEDNYNFSIGGAFDAASSVVTANGLVNENTITINGNAPGSGTAHGELEIHGAASNISTININSGILHITGALTGNGLINLNDGALLELGSSANGSTIHFGSGTSTLKVDADVASSEAVTGFAFGDHIDLSAIVQAALTGGQTPDALVRVVDDPSNAHSLLQIDSDGTANGIVWTTLMELFGIHSSDSVNVILDGSHPAGTSFFVLSNDGHFGDFDGDHTADLVWRNDNGAVAIWQMNGGGVAAGNFITTVTSDWHILGTGDFNGDGKSDILWQNDDGTLLDWQMASSSAIDTAFGIGNAPANGVLAGIGDVDHDSKSDLIWRNTSTGAVTVNTTAGASSTNAVGTDWSVVGVGDFNGDHNADIMFRNASLGVNAAWLMNGTTVSSTVFYSGVPNDWHVEGTGDFNGDGIADLFWHNDNGANAVWLMNASGAVQQAGFFNGVSADWHIVGTGDFNNDLRDDVIWRNDSGATAVWQMNGVSNPVVSFPGGAPTDWATQAHHYDYV